MISGTEIINPDGKTYTKLVTITKDDLKKHNLEGKPQEGLMPYEDFTKKGWYQVERKYGDNLGYVPYKNYIDDPIANKLPTESGKFEIYCQRLVDAYNVYGLSKIAPIAKYEPPRFGYESTFSDWKNKIKGEYPFQYINIHHIRRTHSNLDNVAQLREIFEDTVYMNTLDAEKLGIKHGEHVIVSSPAGKILRRATVTPTLMPGVISLTEGAWFKPDDDEKIDLAGCANSLYPDNMTGEGQTSYNTAICKVEKYTGTAPKADYLWEPRLPKFAK